MTDFNSQLEDLFLEPNNENQIRVVNSIDGLDFNLSLENELTRKNDIRKFVLEFVKNPTEENKEKILELL